MTSVYKAINDLIVRYTTYTDDVIFKNYYNNATLPKHNHYCLMFVLHNKPMMAQLRIEDTPNESNKTVSTGYTQLNSIRMQVDFYGTQAMAQADRFATVMQSPLATDFLNALGYTVQTCDSPEQIDNPQDRDNYVDRYVVRFTLFSNSTITDVIDGFDSVIINSFLVETL